MILGKRNGWTYEARRADGGWRARVVHTDPDTGEIDIHNVMGLWTGRADAILAAWFAGFSIRKAKRLGRTVDEWH